MAPTQIGRYWAALVALLLLTACRGAGDGSEAAISEVGVAEVAVRLARGEVLLFDANDEDTRREYGTIPGARLLSSPVRYDLSELPKDKKRSLVFYCVNSWCSASDSAARRASAAGYQRAAVMRDGIEGWTDAGNLTTSR